VRTVILKADDEIPVDYFLSFVKGRWFIHDVEIDGVSIVDNYQRSFVRVIKRKSYEALLKKMYIQQKAIRESS